MKFLHIAQGAEARMAQLHQAVSTGRPDGARGMAWDVSAPLREALPVLQSALSREPRKVAVVDAVVLAEAIADGVRIPAHRRKAEYADVPGEGGRLVGHADEAVPFVMTAAAMWMVDVLRERGLRGETLREAADKGMASPEIARKFGMVLADAALGVPGATLRALPEGFSFAYAVPTEYSDEPVDEFAEMVGQILYCSGTMTEAESRFEGYVLAGRYERVNSMDIEGIFDAEATHVEDGVGDIAFCAVNASLGHENTLRFVKVPAFRYVLGPRLDQEEENAPEPAYGM